MNDPCVELDRYVTSDCGAVGNVEKDHGYTNTSDDTCSVTLKAGMDNDCGGFFGGNANASKKGAAAAGGNLAQAIADGSVGEETWSPALANLIRVQLRLGMFDPDHEQPYRGYGLSTVDTEEHRTLALDAARQSMVLVKNDGSTLPLKKGEVKKMALLGPNADATVTMQSNYHGKGPFLTSPYEALQGYVPNVTMIHGCTIAGNGASGTPQRNAGSARAPVRSSTRMHTPHGVCTRRMGVRRACRWANGVELTAN